MAFSELLLQSQTLNVGQCRCKTGTTLRHSGARPTSVMPVGSEGLASLSASSLPLYICSCKSLQVLLAFVTLQFNRYKDNENNVNVSSLACELFYSYNQNTCLFGTLSFLPQNMPATFWPGHQASGGWLEMHFDVSVLNGLFQLLMQPIKQTGWNEILLLDVKFPYHRRIELSSCAKFLSLDS